MPIHCGFCNIYPVFDNFHLWVNYLFFRVFFYCLVILHPYQDRCLATVAKYYLIGIMIVPNRKFGSLYDWFLCLLHVWKKIGKKDIFYSPTNWTMSRLALTPSLLVRVRLSPSKIFIFSLLARPTPIIITETGTNVLAVWTRSRLVSLMSLEMSVDD